MITLSKLIDLKPISESCVVLLNQMIYRPAKAYSNSNGTYFDFGNRILKEIKTIHRALINGKYLFKSYIRKVLVRNGKKRFIYIAEWQDKIVEKWLADSLSIALKNWYSKHTYAYKIEGNGIDYCQRQVARSSKHSCYIIRRDITQYFYSIPQDKLMNILATLIPKDDYLYHMLNQRVTNFKCQHGEVQLGVPFGSPLACVLANIYLTSVDKLMESQPIRYFRYADDFLILSDDRYKAKQSMDLLDESIQNLGLALKPSHKQELTYKESDEVFTQVSRFSFLGLEFTNKGLIRLGLAKQRKIIGFFRRMYKNRKSKINNTPKAKRLTYVIESANETLNKRIRSAAIIDYYLKHVTDEAQLKQLDMIIAQLTISAYLNKPFRFKDFSKCSYKTLRTNGLPSLLHRHRLFKQGHLKVDFLAMCNAIVVQRHEDMQAKRTQRLNQLKLAKMSKNIDAKPESTNA